MDFGCCTEASNVISIDFSVSIEVCECLVSKDFFVVGDEVVKFGVEFLDFLLMFACDVFIDLSVSKVLIDALVDVGIS